jgi:hypothetical protein
MAVVNGAAGNVLERNKSRSRAKGKSKGEQDDKQNTKIIRSSEHAGVGGFFDLAADSVCAKPRT